VASLPVPPDRFAGLVAQWRKSRAKGMRVAAAAARKAYSSPHITEHTHAYADDLERAAAVIDGTAPPAPTLEALVDRFADAIAERHEGGVGHVETAKRALLDGVAAAIAAGRVEGVQRAPSTE
jgi:hypothetical protein